MYDFPCAFTEAPIGTICYLRFEIAYDCPEIPPLCQPDPSQQTYLGCSKSLLVKSFFQASSAISASPAMFSLQDFVQQCISESPLLSLVTSRSSSGDVDAKPNEVIMGLFEDGVPLNPSVNRFIIIVPLEIWPNWEGYPIFINFRYFQTPKYNRQLTTFRCFSDF